MPVDRCIVNKENKGPTATQATTKTKIRKTRNEDGVNYEALKKNVGREERKKEEGKQTSKIKSGAG